MPADANATVDELFTAAEGLEPQEFDIFFARLSALQAQRQSPNTADKEAELLLKIRNAVPEDLRRRYNELGVKLEAETLTSAEHSELLGMIDEVENLDAQRIRYIGELARLRGVAIETLLDQLGLRHLVDA